MPRILPYIRISSQPVTFSLLFLQVFMMLLGHFFFSTLAAYNEYISNGEWWRFITSLFLHVDFQHFLSNMICLLILGLSIEKYLGSIAFSIIFLPLVLAVIFSLTSLCPLHISILGHPVAYLVYSAHNFSFFTATIAMQTERNSCYFFQFYLSFSSLLSFILLLILSAI